MSYDSQVDTEAHIKQVRIVINKFVSHLLLRSKMHDASKLKSPEKPIFDEFTPLLRNTTYGSDEYHAYLKKMEVALIHHYKHNRHHPEYYINGIHGMSLIDIVEMFCDWMAATLRHADGDIFKSIKINQERFKYSEDLLHIFENTVKLL